MKRFYKVFNFSRGVLVGILASSLFWIFIIILDVVFSVWLPNSGKSFVGYCANLNGKEFTLENIQTLKGKVYVEYRNGSTVGLEIPVQANIDQFKKMLKGQSIIGIDHVRATSDSGVFSEMSIALSRNDLEDDFKCRITLDKNTGKIKSMPYYVPED